MAPSGRRPRVGDQIRDFLAFLYGPPWAVLWAPLSLLPVDLVVAAVLVAQILALRYVADSWRAAAIVSAVPFVTGEPAAGNVNIVMAAAILAAARNRPGGGAAVALFGLAKVAPFAVLAVASRRTYARGCGGTSRPRTTRSR